MMDTIAVAVVSTLVGIILGGAVSSWVGIRPVREGLERFRVDVAREFGEVRGDLIRLEGVIAQHPFIPHDRRKHSRGEA